MNQFISLCVFLFHLRNLNIEVYMFPFQVLKSECWWCVWDDEINTVRFENPINFFNHFADWYQGIFTAHQGINRGFVKDHLKRLISICHLSYIHYFIHHLVIFFINFNFLHLFDTGHRNVIVNGKNIPRFIKVILNLTVSATDIEYFCLLIVVQVFLNCGLILLKKLQNMLRNLRANQIVDLGIFSICVPNTRDHHSCLK